MKRVLIYTDNSRFNDFKSSIELQVKLVENVYSSLKDWDVTEITIDDLRSIIEKAKAVPRISPGGVASFTFQPQQINVPGLKQIIENYLKEKAVNQAEQPKVFGFNVSKTKLKELIEVPEIPIEVITSLDELITKSNSGGKKFVNMNYFEITANQVVINQQALQEYEESCSHYATTKSQIALAEEIISVCKALNKFKAYGEGFFKLEVKAMNALDNAIMKKNGTFYPDYNFIMKFAR
ncbi:MAG: hypothetical protein HQ521_05950 [Bacteroidetes bacterium]|nr:hypothetical protein [Bacteroidota bacterium]